MMQNKKIKVLMIVIIIGFVMAIISAFCFNNDFLYCTPDYFFQDYQDTITVTDTVYEGVSVGRGYFPFAYVILKIIEVFFKQSKIGFVVTFVAFLFLFVKFFEHFFKDLENKKKIALILTLLICSYPLMFEFIQANIEYIVLALVLLFFIFYKKEKYTLAAIVLAFAICMKLYPAVFALLLLKNKKYRELILCIILTITFMICSFVIIGGTMQNLPIAIENFKFFNELFAIKNHGLPNNHSIWSMIRWFNIDNLFEFSRNNIGIYTISILIITTIISTYLLFIEKEEWKIITILTIMMISFPHISFDYTLLHLYIPITYFVITNQKRKWENIFYAILLGICVLPINYLQRYAYNFTFYIGTIIRPFVFTIIIGTMMFTGIKDFINGKQMLNSAIQKKE